MGALRIVSLVVIFACASVGNDGICQVASEFKTRIDVADPRGVSNVHLPVLMADVRSVFEIEMRNLSGATLVINSVRTSCGCMAASLEKGTAFESRLAMQLAVKPGKDATYSGTMYVECEGGSEFMVRFSAEVERPIEIPSQIYCDTEDPDISISGKVNDKVDPESFELTGAMLGGKAIGVVPDEEGRVAINLGDEGLPGSLSRDTFLIATFRYNYGGESRLYEQQVHVSVVRPLRAIPMSLSISRHAEPGSLTSVLLVKNRPGTGGLAVTLTSGDEEQLSLDDKVRVREFNSKMLHVRLPSDVLINRGSSVPVFSLNDQVVEVPFSVVE